MTATAAAGDVTITSITTAVAGGDINYHRNLSNFRLTREARGNGTKGQPTIFALNQLYADTVANGGCQTAHASGARDVLVVQHVGDDLRGSDIHRRTSGQPARPGTDRSRRPVRCLRPPLLPTGQPGSLRHDCDEGDRPRIPRYHVGTASQHDGHVHGDEERRSDVDHLFVQHQHFLRRYGSSGDLRRRRCDLGPDRPNRDRYGHMEHERGPDPGSAPGRRPNVAGALVGGRPGGVHSKRQRRGRRHRCRQSGASQVDRHFTGTIGAPTRPNTSARQPTARVAFCRA